MAALFLGIDGGGSTTRCLLGDVASLLGRGTSSGCNLLRVGEKRARQALGSAIAQACQMAGVDASEIARTSIGVAGAGRPEIESAVRGFVSEIVSGEIEVVPDMIIARQAAFADGPGVIVISGTGSIAFGRNAQLRSARAGGWGFAISDEGSGHWIGRSALSRVFRAHDQARPTRLAADIAAWWGVERLEQCVLVANASPPPDWAALVPLVQATAESGDEIARAVLEEAGSELARLAGVVVERLFPLDEEVHLAMCGGVFHHCPQVRQAFSNQLGRQFPRGLVGPAIVEPVEGALERARRPQAIGG